MINLKTVTVALGMLIGTSGIASATTLPFNNAKTWQAADAACFYNGSYAGIWNTCDGTGTSRKLFLALPQSTTGSHTFKATGANKGTIWVNPTCQAIVNNAANTTVVFTPSAQVHNTVTLGTLTVNAGDTSHLDCNVFGGDEGLASASW